MSSSRGYTIMILVPKAGLEPAWIAPHAPQTCVSTSSTTSALVHNTIKNLLISIRLFVRCHNLNNSFAIIML